MARSRPSDLSRQAYTVLNTDRYLIGRGVSTFLVEGSLYKTFYNELVNAPVRYFYAIENGEFVPCFTEDEVFELGELLLSSVGLTTGITQGLPIKLVRDGVETDKGWMYIEGTVLYMLFPDEDVSFTQGNTTDLSIAHTIQTFSKLFPETDAYAYQIISPEGV